MLNISLAPPGNCFNFLNELISEGELNFSISKIESWGDSNCGKDCSNCQCEVRINLNFQFESYSKGVDFSGLQV